jgi:hypothetical protein
MKRYHIVQPAETLSTIARTYAVPVQVLRKINDIDGIGRLRAGQKIYLREEDVLGVQALFLDADRNPIPNQKYFFDFGGRVVKGETGPNGLTAMIFTDLPKDQVKMSIERLDSTAKLVATVMSGYRNKLVTIRSPRYRVDGKAERDPGAKAGEVLQVEPARKPIYDPKSPPAATTDKKELGPNATPTKTEDNRPLIKVEGDIPDLDLILDKYTDLDICDADIQDAATNLQCKPGLIYAIARQESSTSSFFKIGDRTVPKILFERHWFRKLTKAKQAPSPYESKYPDICGSAYHLTKQNKKKELIDKETGTVARTDDIYGPQGLHQYKRMLKAYQLNSDAALQACSWGKFQIMGFNYKAAGFEDVKEFVKAMSRNDAENMKAFLKFAKSNSILLAGLRNVDFEKIAEGHNGAGWKTINPDYASNLRKFNDEYAASHETKK